MKIIAAVDKNGIIAVNGEIPWKYPEDLKYFKKKTINNIVVMGRNTFKSIGKPLSRRRNIVISSTLKNNKVEVYNTVEEALMNINTGDRNKVWFIGGQRIYQCALRYVEYIEISLIPEEIQINSYDDVKIFPFLNPYVWKLLTFGSSEGLTVVRYIRKDRMSWTSKIKGIDRKNVRVIPEDNSKPYGKQIVEVFENGNWNTIANSVDKDYAEKMLSQSLNRVIFG